MSQSSTLRVSELAVCLSLFEVGSTTLFLMGGDAKQDAWLAMLAGALGGLLLLLLHLAIHYKEPQLDLFRLFEKQPKSPDHLITVNITCFLSRNMNNAAAL
ncbi:hypothetical protein GCM10010912_56010 [Paenibacillus albidus]|uniref:Spore germination protein n=1 Tax=Paenibacillus albidus TaxID=2041023 RepID=A0A917FUL5_9BACL|nr:GerAB/ArcD/ProY family transporter [Paenibacillus albidus]GGG04047.1 hypothetical protein GCM10010912_56010 [Paenibacillus albidus]